MKLFICILLITLNIIGLSLFCKMVQEDRALALSESECIAQYISAGIERKHISVSNGSCSVRY